MARIEWATLCDLAFFDRQDRLCIIGMFRRLPAPSLPLAINPVLTAERLSLAESSLRACSPPK